eukprot:scaffold17118_cov61-Cyclotella_meneghiniana.AAC.1
MKLPKTSLSPLLLLPSLILLSSWTITLTSAFVPPSTRSSNSRTAMYSAVEKTSAINTLLHGLESRIEKGSLSSDEITSLLSATDEMIGELKRVPQQQPSSVLNTFNNNDDVEQQMLSAAEQLDIDTIDTLLSSGHRMNEEVTAVAFWSAVNEVNRCEQHDQPLPSSLPRILHRIFEADMQHLLNREEDKQTTNVTCMQPDDSGGIAARAQSMSYIFDDGEHKNLPLMEGRRCEGGTCCDACSRNLFATFARDREVDLDVFPGLASFTFNDLETVSTASILQFVRLIERVRRTIAHEYGLPLKSILPLQAYSRKYVAGTTQQGGGGGEGDFVILHTDEATHDGYHYSCVLYLSTHGVDFEGGSFVWNDPAPADEKETKKEEEEEFDEYEIAASSKEEPMISVARVKELFMKWHYICTPLDQH